ncbi:MAG: hypothetical protein HY905_11520 [Deltaproteobacteria bacterium]|nr:hypothetical protein [Deltaproteobacteria bacterium]
MSRYFIGVDDTDYGESIGTGALARELSLHLARALGGRSRGVTRHQLFVHPDIPYTSHNSAACVELECDRGRGAVAEAASRFVAGLLHEGADPGVCVCEAAPLLPALVAFGRSARDTVLCKADAVALAAATGLDCRELGGTGLGIVGALAACGLRMTGDDGRFLSLPGARELTGTLAAGELAARAGIDRVVDEAGREVAAASPVETGDWVRPDLRGGRIVLRVRAEGSGGSYVVLREKRMDKH